MATHSGTDIPNSVEPSVLPSDVVEKNQLLFDTYGKDWKVRKPATGVYNCAGMVWASRRTAIFDPKLFEIILLEDGYRETKDQKEDLYPGDIVVYRFPDNREIVHVARIYELPTLVGSDLRIPWAISKWGWSSGEYLHKYNDVPYQKMLNTRVDIEFYTDRP